MRYSGSGIGGYFITAIAVSPWSGGFDVSEFRCVIGMDDFTTSGATRLKILTPYSGA